MPVRLGEIPARPFPCPSQYAHDSTRLIAYNHRGKDSRLFQQRSPAVAGRCDTAYSNHLRVAKSAENLAAAIQALKYGRVEPLKRSPAKRRFAAESVDVDRVVAHRAAEQQRRRTKLVAL
jgi:uncharacterized protein YaiL (DUF2058 family)